MGGAASAAAAEDPQPEEKWLLENVLFFDPKNSPGRGEVGAAASRRGPTVRRFTPSRAKLRNRNFRVAGKELKQISTASIRYIQRKDTSAEVYVRTDRRETASLSFEFENEQEAELFAEYVLTLFGIQVHFFGTKRMGNARPLDLRDRSDSSDDSIKSYEPEVMPKRQNRAQRRAQALQARTGCPLHGNEPCRCAVERPAVDFLKRNKYETDSSSDEESEINASHSLRYPIAIDGPCEAGKELRLNDLGARGYGRVKAKVAEWFAASRPGKDPVFPPTCEAVGVAFRLQHRHVGRYIQLRASRRLDSSSSNPFVYSLAVKGPVTVDDGTARDMLLILTQREVSYEVTCKGADLQLLFGLSPAAVGSSPFFDLTLTMTREALLLSVSVPSAENPVALQINYNSFFVSLLGEEELDEREEELKLRLHLPFFSPLKSIFQVATAEIFLPSEAALRAVYHTVCFYRLQRGRGSFDRWARDLETGDYSFLKNKYARLWADTPWGVFAAIEGTAEQEAINPLAYAQQLIAKYQHEDPKPQ
ncbi:hypothetical protein, conserved [Eimeria tenella]|uniref:Uncharacterized protein n=1 Tax=Eimeria tenella TaxID=5802 RepID=U6KP47_EIMTE|nr:hypothetical protein, conserved [Eimeria tenella]CDJ38047.1 hypothetical protein, conserved [Eimeria tenella]|eukprot:XP_013228885.1 hypothetical protein, conserved [Eimeria tenella]